MEAEPVRGAQASVEAPTAETVHEGRVERFTEALTMALYVSLSLLAVLAAFPNTGNGDERLNRAALVALTSTGLLLAHLVAFRLSTRLVHHGLIPREERVLLGAQVAGGLAVTAVAVAPVLLLGGTTGVLVSELLLLGFVLVVGYEVARQARMSRGRTLRYLAAVAAVSLLVLGVKSLIGH